MKKVISKPKPRPAAKASETGLNPAQQRAVRHGLRPLLIIAGAGTGKTLTLAHRVADLIARGTPPERILLLTFTRRAAEELLQRVESIRGRASSKRSSPKRAPTPTAPTRKVWGGTFHAVGARLLRIYGQAIGVAPSFTIHDQTDTEDLLDVLRAELKLAEQRKDFPKKGVCRGIQSGWVNSGRELEAFLQASYPWSVKHVEGLRRLFQAYEQRKRQQNVFDYDDLLVFWIKLLSDPAAGDAIRKRFDCVLVDEYQDTNPLQAQILKRLRPDGSGLTAVGDDAQSIYSFRGATVRNILDFPKQFPGTTLIKLEENYRSTQPILGATNVVIAQAAEGIAKKLRTSRTAGAPPRLVPCADEAAEAHYIVEQVLRYQKAGIPLKEQAVLFRASHHSLALEMELARRRIAFHKYGGLKFAEAAHVKDLVAFLRLAENPRDVVSGLRLFRLLPGVGPKKAQSLMDGLLAAEGALDSLTQCKLPATAAQPWSALVALLMELAASPAPSVPTQIRRVLRFYTPLLEAAYDNPEQRLEDLKKLEGLGERAADRSSFLAELTLDPPASTRDVAKRAAPSKDYLVLSTIHSAKGLEWDVVFAINAIEGAIPSSRAETPAQLDEELRLFYVALTRAKTWLTVTYPLYRSNFYGTWNGGLDVPTRTRFLPGRVLAHFEQTIP